MSRLLVLVLTLCPTVVLAHGQGAHSVMHYFSGDHLVQNIFLLIAAVVVYQLVRRYIDT